MKNEPEKNDKDLSPEEMEKIAGGTLKEGGDTGNTDASKLHTIEKVSGGFDARRLRT